MNKELQSIIESIESQDEICCLNTKLHNDSDIKFIIVGDNPGKIEVQKGLFFIGPSGQILRDHFVQKKLCTDFDKECMIYNKTFIHTEITNELIAVKNKIGNKLFDQVLEYCAIEISEKSNALNVPVLIFGKSNLGPNKIFSPFWITLNSRINTPENILVYNHPSKNWFSKEWNDYESKLQANSSLELLLEIGKINRKRIIKEYE